MAFLCKASCHVVGSRGLAYTPLSVHYRYHSHVLFHSTIAYILSDSDVSDSVLSDSDLTDSDNLHSDLYDCDKTGCP
jgi:hypothetical protein